jgi:hypothetical protein
MSWYLTPLFIELSTWLRRFPSLWGTRSFRFVCSDLLQAEGCAHLVAFMSAAKVGNALSPPIGDPILPVLCRTLLGTHQMDRSVCEDATSLFFWKALHIAYQFGIVGALQRKVRVGLSCVADAAVAVVDVTAVVVELVHAPLIERLQQGVLWPSGDRLFESEQKELMVLDLSADERRNLLLAGRIVESDSASGSRTLHFEVFDAVLETVVRFFAKLDHVRIVLHTVAVSEERSVNCVEVPLSEHTRCDFDVCGGAFAFHLTRPIVHEAQGTFDRDLRGHGNHSRGGAAHFPTQ